MITKTTDANNNLVIDVQAMLPPGDAGNIKVVIIKGENHPADSTVNFQVSCATWILSYNDAVTFCNELNLQLTSLNTDTIDINI